MKSSNEEHGEIFLVSHNSDEKTVPIKMFSKEMNEVKRAIVEMYAEPVPKLSCK